MKLYKVVLIQVLIYCFSTLRAADAVPKLPMFYGWFFKDPVALGIATITENHLKNLDFTVPIFHEVLKTNSEMVGIKDPLQYYTKPTDPNTGNFDPDYHVTAHFCGTKDCSSFTNKTKDYLGKAFETEMVGIFFTPRTYGIRVKLSDVQKIIFNMGSNKAKVPAFARDGENQDIIQDALISKNQPSLTQISNSYNSDFPGIDFIDQDDKNFHPTNDRAHVTVGCAPNVSAVVTGLDLLDILKLETKPEKFCGNTSTEFGTLVNMGDNCDIFVYYLKQKMVANATYQAYYYSSAPKRAADDTSHKSFLSTCLEWVLTVMSIRAILK